MALELVIFSKKLGLLGWVFEVNQLLIIVNGFQLVECIGVEPKSMQNASDKLKTFTFLEIFTKSSFGNFINLVPPF